MTKEEIKTLNIYQKLGIIQNRLVAKKGQYNSFGKYNYRSCEDILASVKDLLKDTETNLLLSDEIVLIGERFYVKATATIINQADGESYQVTAYAREEENKKGMDGSQVTGASSSYARKYALNGLFAIDDTKDADTDSYHQVTNQTTKGNKVKEEIDPSKIKATNQEITELGQIYNSTGNDWFLATIASHNLTMEQLSKGDVSQKQVESIKSDYQKYVANKKSSFGK